MLTFLTFDKLVFSTTTFSLKLVEVTMAVTFSRQNDLRSHMRTTSYWENVVLVVVLVFIESKAPYHVLYHVYWQRIAYEISEWQRGFP